MYSKSTRIVAVIVACVAFAAESVHGAMILAPSDVRVVSDQTTTTSLGTVTGGTSEPYPVRSRATLSQDDMQVATFLQFDVSALTIADVNHPDFSAIFQIDYTFQLNTSNDLAILVGRNTSGAWDSSGSHNPLHDWGFDDEAATAAAADGRTLVANVRTTTPPVNDIQVDVSDIVKGWVDGTNPNQGFVLYYNRNAFEGAGFRDAELLITVPEPSTLSLSVLAALNLISRGWRRRKAKKGS